METLGCQHSIFSDEKVVVHLYKVQRRYKETFFLKSGVVIQFLLEHQQLKS